MLSIDENSPPLNAVQRARMDELLDELLDLPEDRRLAALGDHAADDPQVTAAVEAWLRAVHASSDFLAKPARVSADELLPDPTLGIRLGAWRLTRLIGRGGMGDVYEAARVQGGFEQRVAIKLMQRETAAESQRFQTERQILARLDHPGIARLYDGGITGDERLYMVMEYVEGRPITEYCAYEWCSFEQRLELFLQVCDAIAFAHRHQIIHRDLKPANILVTTEGRVKLLDFGIAQLLQSQLARVTQAGSAPMTPICAAPEQLTGQPTTPATDVYALGLLLFELLSGTHPWATPNTHMLQAMRTVLKKSAPLASEAAASQGAPPVAARRIRGDLDAIIGKCLRKEPEHRYATVDALKADVSRVLSGEAVEARKSARLYVIGHTVRRFRWILSAALGAAVLIAVIGRPNQRPAPVGDAGHAVALVGFTPLSGQETATWLPAALTEMLGTELSSGERINLIPDELVRDGAKGLGDAPASAAALHQLGQRLHADYLVTGRYLLSNVAGDSQLRIDVTVQEVLTDKTIARFSQQATMGRLAELVGKIGATLRTTLGATAPSSEQLVQISKALPPTVDVAQKLSLATQAMQNYDAARARDQLLEVVAESPGYAPAYASLSDAWSALGYREKAVAAAQQAEARAATLSGEAQWQIDAALQAAEYQWARAASDWKALIKLKPANIGYHLQAINTWLNAGSPAAAQAALDELLKLPYANDDPRVELVAARVACALDDSKACAAHAQEALRLALALKTPGLAADARNALSIAMMHLGNTDAAISNLHASIESYQAIGNPRGEAESHRTLGRVLVNADREAEGRAEYQQAMTISQSIGDLGGVSAVYRNLCEMLWGSGDRDGAQAAAKHGLEISLQTGDLKLQAWTLRALATIASDESASDEVMREYRDVTALTERSGDRGGHVWSLASYADVARLRGEMDEARTSCAQALTEAAQLSDPQFSVFSLFTCSTVELDQGHLDRAAAMLEEVQAKSETSKNSGYLASTRLELAKIDFERHRCDSALKRLGQAISEMAALELRTGQAESEALSAACYQQLSRFKERDEALKRALALRAAVTSRLEVYAVEIISAKLGSAESGGRDAIVQLTALAADAAHRHWLRWSLEAQLAAWELAQANGQSKTAAQLRAPLERAARLHDMGRILARLGEAQT